MTRPRTSTLVAAGLCALFGAIGASQVSLARSLGWDEAMHMGWPAARMAHGLAAGDLGGLLRAVHDCEQYPFVGPLWTALVWSVTGLSESAARGGARVLWAVGLFGLFLLAREAARGRSGEALAPWLALALAASSPLALAFSGTLFLEVPATVVLIFTLRAWLRRREGGASRDLAAGAWIALLFFTKFNYGLVVGAGLFLDLVVDGVGAGRRGELPVFASRTALLASPVLLAWAWWFGLPLPAGLERGASHRAAFAAWITGNQDFAPTPVALRWLHWGAFLVWAPRVLVVLVAGLVLALARGGNRRSWSLLLAGLVPVLLVASHPFHLDRFLLPLAPPLWVLAGLGLGTVLPERATPRAATLAGLALALFAAPNLDSWWLVRQVGLENPDARDYQQAVLDEWRSLHPGRVLPTNGLERAEFEALLDQVQGQWEPGQRLGWCGVSPSFSPGAIFLGLVERGLPAREALVHPELDRSLIQLGPSDPGWDEAQIQAWAQGFHLLLASRPFDLAGTAGREWVERYQVALATSGAWSYAKLPPLELTRPAGGSQAVELLVLRPSR